MKKWILFIITIILIICGCATGTGSVIVHSGLSLDEAIADAAVQINDRSEAGSKIALINFSSPSDGLSLYVLDELTANLVDSGKLNIVNRAEIDLIRNEYAFQYSGEVADDSMQELGRLLGAQFIVTGSLMEISRDMYRIVIRVLNVQTALIPVQYRADIAYDNRVQFLLGRQDVAVPAPVPVPSSPASRPQRTDRERTVREYTPTVRLNSVGASAGTSFTPPWLTGAAFGTFSLFNNTFFEAGFDYGFLSGIDGLTINSYYPYINFAFFMPVMSRIDWYAGLGAGWMFYNYSFDSGYELSDSVLAMNVNTGIIIMDLFNISYTFRTNFASVSNKLSLGVIWRFNKGGSNE